MNRNYVKGRQLRITGLKQKDMKEFVMESPSINVEEEGHTFSFVHRLSNSFPEDLNVYADDKLLYTFKNRRDYSSNWKKAIIELPTGNYKVWLSL